MNILQKILNPASSKNVELEITRNVFVNGTRYDEGEAAKFDALTASELLGSGAAIDPADEAARAARTQRLASLLPAPGEVRPVPESWQKLPKCFAAWWELNQKGLLLVHRAADIEERLISRMQQTMLPSLKGIQNLHWTDQSRLIRGLNFSIGVEETKAGLDEQRHLKDAFRRAEQAVTDWRDANGAELLRLKIQCSDYAQSVHGATCKAIRELHQTAFDLFSNRIAALGLAKAHVERLFAGSADAVKFCAIEPPTLQDRKLAWIEQDGEPRFYVDQPPSTMAEMIFGWEKSAGQVAALTKQAKAELAVARKVQA